MLNNDNNNINEVRQSKNESPKNFGEDKKMWNSLKEKGWDIK